MIEHIGYANQDLSFLIDNSIAKISKSEPQKSIIEDVVISNSPAENYSGYNDKGQISVNHTVLPERYNTNTLQGYIYYKGERMSQLELLQEAVDKGAIELDESESVFVNYDKAWQALVEAKAKPLFSWSKALYSEDGMYLFRVEDGQITGMTLAQNSNGVRYVDVVKDLANGIRPCDMPDINYLDLAHRDPELYQAACQIGSAKRKYDIALDDNKTLFEILFGFDVNNNIKDFATLALQNYNQARYNLFF